MPEAVIVSAVRTPIGRAHKGSLVDIRPEDLAGSDPRHSGLLPDDGRGIGAELFDAGEKRWRAEELLAELLQRFPKAPRRLGLSTR